MTDGRDARAHPPSHHADTLVLGGRGFLGARIALACIAAGRTPIGVDRAEVGASGSLDAALRSSLSPRITLVFHAAGVVGEATEADQRRAHVESTEVLLRSIASVTPSARTVIVGSAAEIGGSPAGRVPEREGGSPTTRYGASKLEQSLLALELGSRLGVDVLRVRVFNTLGAGQSSALVGGALVDRMARAVEAGHHSVDVADPASERDFLDADDVARAVLRLASELPAERTRHPINVGSEEGTSIAALTGELLAASGADLRIHWVPGRGASSRSVAECPTLRRVIGDAPVRTISTLAALRRMWSARITRGTHE